MASRARREQSPSRPHPPRGSKAEQAPDRRLVVDQLALGRLRDLVSTYPEVAQLRSCTQAVKQFRVALKLGEVIGVQDDRLDVLRAVTLNHKRLSRLRIGQTDIVALDGRAVQSHIGKDSSGIGRKFSKSYEIASDYLALSRRVPARRVSEMGICRIDEIRIRFGARPESGPTTVELGPVPVLVGPNNGGKSRTLSHLQEYAGRGNQSPMPAWNGV